MSIAREFQIVGAILDKLCVHMYIVIVICVIIKLTHLSQC